MSIKRFFPEIRPTLDLNFAATKRLDPRITYTRASAGTFAGENGLIQSAAVNQARFEHNPTTGESLGLLVEEARTNVLQYGEYLDNSYWTRSNCTVIPNAAMSPNGKYTVSRLTANSTGASYLRFNYTPTTAGFFTVSCYFSSAQTNKYPVISIHRNNSQSAGAKFDLVNETVLVVNSSDGSGSNNPRSASANIVSVGNGIYRCSMSWNRLGIDTFISISLGDSSTTNIFGNRLVDPATAISVAAQQSLEAWGFSMEAGSFPTSYIPTPATFTGRTSTATFYDSAGIVQTAASGVARSDAFFPDSNNIFRPAGLLLEAAGTNLLNHSQTFATSGGTQNDWVDTNVSRDGTLRTSPDGTANALRITASAANATVISSSGIGTSAARNLSVFLRRVTGSGAVEYTLDNGSTYAAQAISSSWVRYAFPATTANQQVGVRLATSGDAIELWGAQLEAGSFATSYIATTTTTATRSADTSTSSTVTRAADVASITGTNFSSWYNAAQSTILAKLQNVNASGANSIWSFDDGTSSQRIMFGLGVGTQITNFSGITDTANPYTATHAFAITANNLSGAKNGTLYAAPTGTSVPIVTQLQFGVSPTVNRSSGIISRLTYWPTRLPDATLQAITQ